MNIELHIEELVLHGFEAGDRQAIGEAVQGELSRLLAERGVPASLADGGELGHVDGGAFNARPGAGAESIGAQIASVVHGGLRR